MMQYNNAPAHGSADDVAVANADTRGRTIISLEAQSPNVLDLNVLDLGLFNSI